MLDIGTIGYILYTIMTSVILVLVLVVDRRNHQIDKLRDEARSVLADMEWYRTQYRVTYNLYRQQTLLNEELLAEEFTGEELPDELRHLTDQL